MSKEASTDARNAKALLEDEIEEFNEEWRKEHEEMTMKNTKSLERVCSHSDHLAMECKKSIKAMEKVKTGKMDKRLSETFMSESPKIKFSNK
jgi:hypothetical protein